MEKVIGIALIGDETLMINEKDLRGRRRHLINTDSSFV
jgi:hypothetical protein